MFFAFMTREDLYKYFLELKLKKCYVIDLTLNYATGELDFEEINKHGLQKPMKVFVMNEERLKQWSTLPMNCYYNENSEMSDWLVQGQK